MKLYSVKSIKANSLIITHARVHILFNKISAFIIIIIPKYIAITLVMKRILNHRYFFMSD
jgi:hypothetical protein